MAVTKRREAERAVVRCALEAREQVGDYLTHMTMLIERNPGFPGQRWNLDVEVLGALLSAIDTLRDLPTLGIDQPRPAVRDDATDTSRAAARRVAVTHGTKRRTIYELVGQRQQGLTDKELEHLTGWPHETVSAARNSLVENGWLYDSGLRRPRSIVWMARAEEPNS